MYCYFNAKQITNIRANRTRKQNKLTQLQDYKRKSQSVTEQEILYI